MHPARSRLCGPRLATARRQQHARGRSGRARGIEGDTPRKGAVTPTWIGAALGLKGALTSGRGGGSPPPERFVSKYAKRAAGSEMTLDVERVVNGGVNGQE